MSPWLAGWLEKCRDSRWLELRAAAWERDGYALAAADMCIARRSWMEELGKILIGDQDEMMLRTPFGNVFLAREPEPGKRTHIIGGDENYATYWTLGEWNGQPY